MNDNNSTHEAPAFLRHANSDSVDELSEIARAVAAILKDENVHAVFGEPQKLDTHVVVPVARVEVGGGGGAVHALGAAVDAVRAFVFRRRGPRERKDEKHIAPSRSLALGGGAGMKIVPMGFLHEEDGHIVYTTIPAAE